MPIQGIDVSNWQGAVDWHAVAAAGIAFAFAKCTEGTNYFDPTFQQNWDGMKAAGIARAAYHFARPTLNTPVAEAAFFLAHIGTLEPGDVVALDLEDGVGDLTAWTETWLHQVAQALGFKPLLYSAPWFLQQHNMTTDAALSDNGLWLASWNVPNPTVPAPWTFWAVWQMSAQGTVPGVPGQVDTDEFNGTVEQFRAYGLPQPPAPKVPTNDDLVAMERFILAQPPDIKGLITYAQPFAP